MLILSRRVGEAIVIGDRIEVRVQQVSRNRVRLTIEASKDVRVDREEIWLEKHKDEGRETMPSPK